MTASPLWLCLKIAGGKERKAHELFVRHFISSLPPLTQTVRVNRNSALPRAAQRTAERMLLPGYAFVARDHSEPTWFEARLLRLEWPASEARVVNRIVGWVRHDSIMDLIDAAEVQATPSPPTLKAGDKARILVAGDMREVMLSVVKGRRVRVMLDGREISTTLDKLEAA